MSKAYLAVKSRKQRDGSSAWLKAKRQAPSAKRKNRPSASGLCLEKGGSGLINIHAMINNKKYYYNETVEAFMDESGNRLPNSLRGNKEIFNSLKKAQSKKAAGWGK